MIVAEYFIHDVARKKEKTFLSRHITSFKRCFDICITFWRWKHVVSTLKRRYVGSGLGKNILNPLFTGIFTIFELDQISIWQVYLSVITKTAFSCVFIYIPFLELYMLRQVSQKERFECFKIKIEVFSGFFIWLVNTKTFPNSVIIVVDVDTKLTSALLLFFL